MWKFLSKSGGFTKGKTPLALTHSLQLLAFFVKFFSKMTSLRIFAAFGLGAEL